jgi:hypothetical protein
MRDFGEHSPRFCSEERATGGNPARGIKKPPIRKMERFLSDDEIARLSAALEFEATSSGNPYASAAIKLLLLTGCRRGEILNLYGRMLTSKGNAFVSQTARRARRLSISTRPHLSYSGVSRTLRVTPMSLLDRKMHRLSPDWIRSGTGCASPQDSAMSAYMIFATVLQASEY